MESKQVVGVYFNQTLIITLLSKRKNSTTYRGDQLDHKPADIWLITVHGLPSQTHLYDFPSVWVAVAIKAFTKKINLEQIQTDNLPRINCSYYNWHFLHLSVKCLLQAMDCCAFTVRLLNLNYGHYWADSKFTSRSIGRLNPKEALQCKK